MIRSEYQRPNLHSPATRMMRLRTFGACEIQLAERCLGPSSGRSFALLLYLALERGRPVSRAILRDLLFPEADERHSSHSMRQLLYQLRQLEAPIAVDADTIGLGCSDIADDLADVLSGKTLSDPLIHLVAKGFLPGYTPSFSSPFLSWLETTRRQVHVRVLQRLLVCLAQERDEGNWEKLASVARACLTYDPLHHEATLALAESLAMVGSSADALVVLDHYRSELDDDLTELRRPAAVLRRRIAENKARHLVVEAPFQGRGAELSQLRHLVRETQQGMSRIVVLQGEPGIGKSRVAAEAARHASLEGTTVCRVLAHPRDRRRPFSVFGEITAHLQALPGALGCTPESFATLRRLSSRPSDDARTVPDAVDHERLSAELVRSVHDLFGAVTSEQHLLLLIEDGHHLDDLSRELLVDLTHKATQHRLLVLVTSRERSFLEADRQVDSLVPLKVGPLDPDASRTLLLALAPRIVERGGAHLVDWCLQCAGGNPFFLTALGIHYRHGGTAGELPRSLADLIQQRLDQLSSSSTAVLQAVIMLGRHATVSRLTAMLELPAIELLSSLQVLEESGVLVSDAAVIRSSHDLLSEAVVARISAATGQLLHLRCARVLEADVTAASDASLIWDCAEHWRDAGDAARAVSFLRSCGNHALALGQPQYAAEIFHHAAQRESRDRARAELLQQTIDAASLASDHHLVLIGVRGLRQLATEHAEPDHDPLEMIEFRAMAATGAQIANLTDRLRQCLSAPEVNTAHRVHAAMRLLNIAEYQYRADLAHEAASALRSIKSTDHSEELGCRWFDLHYSLQFGEVDRVLSLAPYLAARAADLTMWESQGSVASQVAFALHYVGNSSHAEERMIDAFRDEERRGSRAAAHWCACALAEWRIDVGDLAGAKEWLTTADDLQRRLQHHAFKGGRVASWIRIAILEQRPDEAEVLLNDAQMQFPALSHLRMRASIAAYRAQIARIRNQRVDTRDLSLLEQAYNHGSSTLQFDEIMAALWLSLNDVGRGLDASTLLRQYMGRRRPRHVPVVELQWALRRTSSMGCVDCLQPQTTAT